jgi:uncharacterized protein YaiE (UPF0345 family)
MVSLRNIAIKGNVKSLSSNQFSGSQPTGSIEFKNVDFTSNGEKFHVVSGVADVKNNEVSINNMQINTGSSDVHANIIISNWLRLFFQYQINRH